VKLACNRAAERVEGHRLAVHQKSLARRRLKAREPSQQFAFSGMCGQLAYVDDFRPHRHLFSENADVFRSVLQRAAARRLRLVAHQQDGAAGIG